MKAVRVTVTLDVCVPDKDSIPIARDTVAKALTRIVDPRWPEIGIVGASVEKLETLVIA